MKKEHKIFALFLLSALAILALAGVVAAAISVQGFTDSLKNLGSSSGFLDFLSRLITPSILFAVLIFLIIFAVVSTLPFLKTAAKWVKIGVSVVVALLSGAFISPDVILPLVNQYTALGITISFVLPFILIFYFIKETVPQNRLVQKGIWVIYFTALAISYISNAEGLKGTAQFIYFAMGAGAAFMFIWGKKVYDMLWREELKEAVAATEARDKAIIAAQLQELIRLKKEAKMGSRERQELEDRINDLQAELSSATSR